MECQSTSVDSVIRIQIGFMFSNFLDPVPYPEYGSTQLTQETAIFLCPCTGTNEAMLYCRYWYGGTGTDMIYFNLMIIK